MSRARSELSPPAPLSPAGTVRERLARLTEDAQSRGDSLRDFFSRLFAAAAHHDLGEDAVILAEELLRPASFLGERQKQALALLVLASLVSAREGSTRVPLGGGAGSWLGRLVRTASEATGLDLPVGQLLREMRRLAGSVEFDQLIGRPGEYRPLIADGPWLYRQRTHAHEVRLADHLRARLSPLPPSDTPAPNPTPSPALADLLARPERRGETELSLSEQQLDAVRLGLEGRLAVISGGPGTGKTAIVTTLVRALARLGVPASEIALAAPTGKAAQRMADSLRTGLASIAAPSDCDMALAAAPPRPRTLHRLLGYLPSSGRFRRHQGHPLTAGAVIVDEASMIDLGLFEKLLAAVPPSARLVFLGDADQLPSVEAGAVFRDLVEAASAAEPSFAVRLEKSYRMDPSDPEGRRILEAARAIHAGDARPLLSGGFLAAEPAAAFVARWFRERIAGDPRYRRRAGQVYRQESAAIAGEDREALAELFALHARARLLTVTRRFATGCEAQNRRLHEMVLAEATVSGHPDFYPGEPIVMRKNDYERGLYNGDQGVVVRVAEQDGRHHFRAVFRRGEEYAVFPLEALRGSIELAFAVTVHRSQGSEHEEVALLLPEEDLPLLTRELLYTAVTRARRKVLIIGEKSLVRAAVRRPTRRFSGVAERLCCPSRHVSP